MVDPLPLDTDDLENKEHPNSNESFGMEGIDVQLEDHDNVKYPSAAAAAS